MPSSRAFLYTILKFTIDKFLNIRKIGHKTVNHDAQDNRIEK